MSKHYKLTDEIAFFTKFFSSSSSFNSPKKKSDTKPEAEDSIKKEYCEWCVAGYDSDKYYEHTCLEHFRKLFEEHIIPENAKDMRYLLYALDY